MSNVRDAEQIKEILVARGIKRLLHFTQLSNLESILENGLLTREQIKEKRLNSAVSDSYRLDEHPNTTCCCSIEFPNHKMLYKTKKKKKGARWVIIVLDTNILLEKECAFYPMNAAKKEFKNKNLNDFKGLAAFEVMFKEVVGSCSRKKNKFRDYYTTDVQAEVLVFGGIEKKYISCVCTDDKNMADTWNAKELDIPFICEHDLFQERYKHRGWRY